MRDYELIVIGAGPAGQKAALQAAKLKRRVAVVERAPDVGGACVTTGTLPSKTLRETVHFFAGVRRRAITTGGTRPARRLTMRQLLKRKSAVTRHETEVIRDALERNRIDIIAGSARLLDGHSIEVTSPDGHTRTYTSDKTIIATGSRPHRPDYLPSDPRVLDSDSVLDLDAIPSTLTVLGGGVIGCEYACVFAQLGTKVTLVDRRARLLRFMDEEITDALLYQMRANDVTFKLNEEVDGVAIADDGRVETRLRSGKIIRTERLFAAMGRASNVESLNLDSVNVDVCGRGLIQVDGAFKTTEDSIYAVGDCVGFPALASTSMEQGRIAALHALTGEAHAFPTAFPYGIYTIPEMSYAGANEHELTDKGVPYEIGRAEYGETARGKILGDTEGVLKLLFHRETLELLGVHIIGESATELVHIGQAVMAHKGKVSFFVESVFNYPTLAEAYKIAALNGLNRL